MVCSSAVVMQTSLPCHRSPYPLLCSPALHSTAGLFRPVRNVLRRSSVFPFVFFLPPPRLFNNPDIWCQISNTNINFSLYRRHLTTLPRELSNTCVATTGDQSTDDARPLVSLGTSCPLCSLQLPRSMRIFCPAPPYYNFSAAQGRLLPQLHLSPGPSS